MGKKKKYIFIIVLAGLLCITIVTSHSNRNNYYVKFKAGAVEISKGRFSPLGKELFIIMPGAQPPSPVKKVYSREEIFPYITKYYIDKADAVLDVPGLPDFDGIRTYLNKSLSYAITPDLQKEAGIRLDRIDRMVLIYKADIATSKDTIPELKAALEYLNRASSLGPDAIESELIRHKTESVRDRMKAIGTEQKGTAVQEKPAK